MCHVKNNTFTFGAGSQRHIVRDSPKTLQDSSHTHDGRQLHFIISARTLIWNLIPKSRGRNYGCICLFRIYTRNPLVILNSYKEYSTHNNQYTKPSSETSKIRVTHCGCALILRTCQNRLFAYGINMRRGLRRKRIK